MQLGYEPSRITNLTQQSQSAARALNAIHSDDPAAVDAMAAIARLESVITNGLIPAATTVGILNPLDGAPDWSQIHNLKPTPRSPYEIWMDRTFPSVPHRLDTDDELLAELIDLSRRVPFVARSNPDHPYWDDFDDLANEVAVRVIDAETGEITQFGQLLLDNVWQLPALPVAIARVDFDPRFSAQALVMIFDPDLAGSSEVHRAEAFGANLILARLLDHPEAIAEVIQLDHAALDAGTVTIEETFLFQLLDSDVIDQELLGEVVGVILDPSGPVDLGDIERTLAVFVLVANEREFERGFTEPVAVALAVALLDLLPELADQIRLGQPIFFDDIGDDEAILLGEYGDVRDLVGAILVNPAGLVLLLGLGTEARDIVSVDGSEVDVHAFAELIREAFKENLAEIDIANARSRAQWNMVIAAISAAVGLGPVGKALGSSGVKLARSIIKRFGSAAATATSETSDGEDLAYLAQVMILFGSYEGFLDDHDARGRGGSTAARTILAEAWAQFEAGEPLGRVAETLGDVAQEIEKLGGGDFIDTEVADAIHDIDPIFSQPDL